MHLLCIETQNLSCKFTFAETYSLFLANSDTTAIALPCAEMPNSDLGSYSYNVHKHHKKKKMPKKSSKTCLLLLFLLYTHNIHNNRTLLCEIHRFRILFLFAATIIIMCAVCISSSFQFKTRKCCSSEAVVLFEQFVGCEKLDMYSNRSSAFEIGFSPQKTYTIFK